MASIAPNLKPFDLEETLITLTHLRNDLADHLKPMGKKYEKIPIDDKRLGLIRRIFDMFIGNNIYRVFSAVGVTVQITENHRPLVTEPWQPSKFMRSYTYNPKMPCVILFSTKRNDKINLQIVQKNKITTIQDIAHVSNIYFYEVDYTPSKEQREVRNYTSIITSSLFDRHKSIDLEFAGIEECLSTILRAVAVLKASNAAKQKTNEVSDKAGSNTPQTKMKFTALEVEEAHYKLIHK